MTSFKDLVSRQISCAVDAFDAGLADNDVHTAFTRALDSITSLERVYGQVKHRREYKVYLQAIRELHHSLMAAATGNYRSAFGSMRLWFELSLAGIEFSANERLMRAWEQGSEDIFWDRLSDHDSGVLGKKYAALFFPGLEENVTHYRNLAKTVYRECSEFVHGNPSASGKLPDTLRYKRSVALDWSRKLDTMQLVLVFAFCLRYLNEATDDQKDCISEILLSHVGHIQIIRATLGGTTGG